MAKDERTKLVIDAGHAVLVLQDNGHLVLVRWFSNGGPGANELYVPNNESATTTDTTFAELHDFITACAARRAAAALDVPPEPPIQVPTLTAAGSTAGANALNQKLQGRSFTTKGTP